MVAQFPEVSTVPDPWLIPKLDIFLNIKDVATSEPNPLESGQQTGTSTSRVARVVEMDVIASGIQISLIKNAVTRLFEYIKGAVANDINITPANLAALPLSPYRTPTDEPQIKVTLQVDRSKPEKTVNFQLKTLNLKADSLTATFDRLLMYIDASVINDMNPSM